METLLVNDAEASRLLAISRSKFHMLVAQGRIKRVKLGRSARYRRSDLLAFTERLSDQAEDDATLAPMAPALSGDNRGGDRQRPT